MSDHKQGTELSNLMPTGIPASGTQGAGLDQAAPMEGQDNDIEKAGGAVHALIPKIVVTAASPGPDLAGVPGEMKPGFFGKLKQSLKIQLQKPVLFWKKTDKRTMLTVSSCVVTVMMLCAMIPLAVVAVHENKAAPSMARAVQWFPVPVPVPSIHTIAVQQRDRFSTNLTGDSQIVPLTSTTGDTCDDETGSVAVQSSAIITTNTVDFNNVTSISNTMMQSTSMMPVSVDVLTLTRPSVNSFLTASSMAPAVTSSILTVIPSSSTTQTCLEYGDGAGPCARPYGRPNSTPESWLASLAAESLGDTSTLPIGINATVLPIGIPVMASSNAFTSSFTDASLSSLMDSTTIDASLCEPTATVYVTITAGSEPSNSNLTALGGSGGTVFATSTSLSILTVTLTDKNGPLTTTETALGVGANSTANHTVPAVNGSGGLTTLDAPSNYTLTLHTTAPPNGTAFNSAGATAPDPIVSSGGQQLTVPKPLGMGGSVSGNGVYCVVMLVALAALLI